MVTVVGISRMPWPWRFAPLTGQTTLEALERDTAELACGVGRAAMRMLLISVRGVYIVCGGWWDPALRDYLSRAGYDRLIRGEKTPVGPRASREVGSPRNKCAGSIGRLTADANRGLEASSDAV